MDENNGISRERGTLGIVALEAIAPEDRARLCSDAPFLFSAIGGQTEAFLFRIPQEEVEGRLSLFGFSKGFGGIFRAAVRSRFTFVGFFSQDHPIIQNRFAADSGTLITLAVLEPAFAWVIRNAASASGSERPFIVTGEIVRTTSSSATPGAPASGAPPDSPLTAEQIERLGAALEEGEESDEIPFPGPQ